MNEIIEKQTNSAIEQNTGEPESIEKEKERVKELLGKKENLKDF